PALAAGTFRPVRGLAPYRINRDPSSPSTCRDAGVVIRSARCQKKGRSRCYAAGPELPTIQPWVRLELFLQPLWRHHQSGLIRPSVSSAPPLHRTGGLAEPPRQFSCVDVLPP